MKEMLNIIKYDYKKIRLMFAVLFSLLLIIFFLYIIMIITTQDFVKLTAYVNAVSIVSFLIIGICFISVLFISIKRMVFNINIYKISETKEITVMIARNIFVMGLMALAFMICVLLNTATYALADGQTELLIVYSEKYYSMLNMIGKPFLSWLIIPAAGLLSGLILLDPLVVTLFDDKIKIAGIKRICTVSVLIVLSAIQIYGCSIMVDLFEV